MARILFLRLLGSVICILIFFPTSYAQWTSAHPGMEWNCRMTGRTTGHIADLWMSNETEDTLTVTVGPFYIPGPAQPYVTDGPYTAEVPPGETVVLPVDGSCAYRHVKPPKPGIEIDPDSWLTLDDVSLPLPGTLLPESQGWEPLDNPLEQDLLVKYPGHEVLLEYTIDDFTDRPEAVAPFVFECSNLLRQSYDDLLVGTTITTPIGTIEREEEVLVQLGIWQFTSGLAGENFTLDDYKGDVEKEYKETYGTRVDQLDAESQAIMEKGVQDIWNSAIDLGEAARTVNTPYTWYTWNQKRCKCDSLILDGDLVLKGSGDTLATWNEKLGFKGEKTIWNDTVYSTRYIVDPLSRDDLFSAAQYMISIRLLVFPEITKLLDELDNEALSADQRIEKLKVGLMQFMKEVLREDWDPDFFEDRWDDLLFIGKAVEFELRIRDLGLTCICNQRDPGTDQYDDCDNIYGGRSIIGEGEDAEISTSYDDQVMVEMMITKYTKKAGVEKRAGNILKRAAPVPVGDRYHNFGFEEFLRRLSRVLEFKGKGAHQETSSVLVKVKLRAFCNDEDCGGLRVFTECQKFLYVHFKGIGEW